jgi:hypothetical protein
MADMKTDKVRQGRSGRPVLYVLIGGLVLCVIVFIGLGFYGRALPDQNIGGAANSGVSTAPATPTGSTSTTVTPGEATSAPASSGAATTTVPAN